MFIDDLTRFALRIPGQEWHAEPLKLATRFQVDNVARYVHNDAKENGHRPFDINKEIPNVAPLAPVMWFECTGESIEQGNLVYLGCLLCAVYDSVTGIGAHTYQKIINDDTRWILRVECFSMHDYLNPEFFISGGVQFIGVDRDGQICDVVEAPNTEWGEQHPNFEPSDNWCEEVLIPLTAICFAHCKGAEIKEHQPSRQVRRNAERKGEPITTHRTIDIRPATRVLHEEGDVTKNGLGKALHICRGHFAHYTAEKPLFGKYVGTVYKPMHVRGRADEGTVTKDYRVHTGPRKSKEASAVPV